MGIEPHAALAPAVRFPRVINLPCTIMASSSTFPTGTSFVTVRNSSTLGENPSPVEDPTAVGGGSSAHQSPIGCAQRYVHSLVPRPG